MTFDKHGTCGRLLHLAQQLQALFALSVWVALAAHNKVPRRLLKPRRGRSARRALLGTLRQYLARYGACNFLLTCLTGCLRRSSCKCSSPAPVRAWRTCACLNCTICQILGLLVQGRRLSSIEPCIAETGNMARATPHSYPTSVGIKMYLCRGG
jgi:hypothetical protein